MTPAVLQALVAGATVVTPNRRLARAVKREFDEARVTGGARVWTSADVLPWRAWLDRTFADLNRHEAAVRVLSAAQEMALWQQAIADSTAAHALLDTAATARVARDAWAQQQGWRLDLAGWRSGLHEDGKAYLSWASRFQTRCAAGGWLSAAALPDAIAARLVGGRVPESLVMFGFDELTPQQHALLDALRSAGTRVEEAQPHAAGAKLSRRTYPSAADELLAVARSVRDLLRADPTLAIGVVVPDLSQRRAEVARVFDDVLEPERVLAGSRQRPRAWNLSLGLPLSACPLAHGALSILRLARGPLPLNEAGSLLRSPFLVGAEQEFTRRAQLDARLRERGQLRVDMTGLQREAFARDREQPHACRVLASRLEAWIPVARAARNLRQLPSAWSSTFLALLSALGWPGERALDSEEFQTWEKWRELVAGLSILDSVVGALRFDDALAWLSRLATETVFQAESEAVQVQVLGVLEAAGLGFDHLFVTGLHDEAWPPAPRPNPLLPVALQRAHRMPHASAEWELGFAQRIGRLWRTSARHVVFSHAARDGDRVLRPSPLIADVPAVTVEAPREPTYAGSILGAARLETLVDAAAPPLAPGHEVRGGASVFENQAACPFKAFARHRLGAYGLEEARSGLDARERGTLLHRALAVLWGDLGSHEQLLALSAGDLDAAVTRAVNAALEVLRRDRPDVMTDAFAAIERERLRARVSSLLAMERERAPFRVAEREAPRALEVGGLRVNARVDRVDVLDDGGRVILDYKTGKATIAAWVGDRPDAPQLPLYAITDPSDVAAVALVPVQAHDVRFRGLAREQSLLPGVKTPEQEREFAELGGWPALLSGWRRALDALAGEFLAGRAVVMPKRYPQTCQYCDLGPLCRVKELFDRGPVSADDEEQDESDDG